MPKRLATFIEELRRQNEEVEFYLNWGIFDIIASKKKSDKDEQDDDDDTKAYPEKYEAEVLCMRVAEGDIPTYRNLYYETDYAEVFKFYVLKLIRSN